MRSQFLLLFVTCVGCGAPPAHAPTGDQDDSDAVGRTHMEGVDLTLDLAGRWKEAPMEAGHDLRKLQKGKEEIIVVLWPRPKGLDANSSAARLADAQRSGITTLCKRGVVVSAPTPVTARPSALRFHVACDEPRMVATYIALTVETDVLSYEHYWYEVPGYSAALDHTDDEILAGVQVHSLAAACPSASVEQAISGGAVGVCLEAAVLGHAAVERCGQALASRNWTRDDMAAQAVGRQTAKTVVCFRRPR